MIVNSIEITTAFMEGFLLAISPCILSVLPIIFSGSMDGGKWRPAGIIMGLMISFIFFSLFLGEIFQAFGIRPEILKLFAAFLILGFGLIMVFPALSDRFQVYSSGFAKTGNFISQKAEQFKQMNGLISGLLIGVSLGLIWTPCIGPLLGTAIAQASSQTNLVQNLSIIGSFCLGVAFPLMVFLILSKNLVEQVNFLKQNGKKLQQVFGSIIVISVLFTSKSSLSFAQAWLRSNVFGDKSIHITEIKEVKGPQIGCPLNIYY